MVRRCCDGGGGYNKYSGKCPAAFSRTVIFHAARDERAARMRIYVANCFSLFLFANAIRSEHVCVCGKSTRGARVDRKKDEYDKNLIARRIDRSTWFSSARCKFAIHVINKGGRKKIDRYWLHLHLRKTLRMMILSIHDLFIFFTMYNRDATKPAYMKRGKAAKLRELCLRNVGEHNGTMENSTNWCLCCPKATLERNPEISRFYSGCMKSLFRNTVFRQMNGTLRVTITRRFVLRCINKRWVSVRIERRDKFANRSKNLWPRNCNWYLHMETSVYDGTCIARQRMWKHHAFVLGEEEVKWCGWNINPREIIAVRVTKCLKFSERE